MQIDDDVHRIMGLQSVSITLPSRAMKVVIDRSLSFKKGLAELVTNS